jgi:hypothetical protein
VASRVGARLLTGPLAFLVGGLLDIGTLMVRATLARARRTGDGPAADALSSGGV